jgi:hypothetical protein
MQARNPPPPVPPNAPQSGWSITSQAPQQGDDGSGKLVDGYRVNFKVGNTNAWVFISRAMYSPENVRAAVAAHAAQLAQVSQLTG